MKDQKKKALLIIPPCGDYPTSYPPYGSLYIGTYLEDNGYEVLVVNNDLDRESNELLVQKIKDFDIMINCITQNCIWK